MSIASPSRIPTAREGVVRALPANGGRAGGEPPRRAPSWLNYFLAIVAIAALLAVMVADTGTVRLNRPPPLRVEVPGLAVDEIVMTWDTHAVENGRIVGVAADRDEPFAVALLGEGSPAMLDTATGRPARFNDPGGSPAYDASAVVRSGEATLILGLSAERAHVWRAPNELDHPGRAERATQVGLAELEEPIGGAASSGLHLILGKDGAGRTLAWVGSGNGKWDSRPVTGLARADIDVIATTGKTFLAGGSECSADGCVPAVWRTTDGTTWSRGTGLGREEARVTGIAASGETVYAVGTTTAGLGMSWRSADAGRTWTMEATEGWRTKVSVTVDEIDRESLPRTARLTVNGETVVVRDGGAIVTPFGDIAVEGLDEMALLAAGDATRIVPVGGSWVVRGVMEIEDLDIRDGTIVAVGARRAPGGPPAPTAWIRDETSTAWEASALPGSVPPEHVGIGADHVLVAGSSQREAVVWLGTVTLPDAELEAMAAVGDLLRGLSSGDAGLTGRALAPGSGGSSVLELPGLGGVDLDPRHPSGAIDADRLDRITGFVSALETTITATGCEARAAFGDRTSIRVECDHTTTSSLLELLGVPEIEGTLTATTRDGLVTSLTVDGPAETDALNELDAFMVAYRAYLEDRETSIAALEQPDADTAVLLLEAAAAMATFAFSPGETRVVDGPLGTMEVSWIVEPYGPTAGSVTSLDWTGSAYVAATSDWENEATALWSSPDGAVWKVMSAPETSARVETLFSLPGNRLVAWGEARSEFRLWMREDGAWRELALPFSGAGEMWIRAKAGNDDGAVLVAGNRNRGRGTNRVSGFYVGADGEVRAVDLPADAERRQVALAANRNGFLLATRGENGARVWGSSSGLEWRLLSEQPIDLSGWIVDLEWHRGRYLALTEVDWEEACAGAEPSCTPPRDIWTSPDGVTWEKLTTTPDAGSAIMSEMAGGDLGLISPVRYGRAFLLLWMSRDGSAWSVPAQILPRVARTEWWKAGAVVGASGFVLDTTQQNWQEQPSVSVIVARIVDD